MNEEAESSGAGRWFDYARDDLRAAEQGSAVLVPWQRCFHAQQAAEKALKGALTLLRLEFPWRHDLELLRHLLPEDWTARTEPPSLAWLTTWATDQRYPGQLPEATEADVRRAIDEARVLLGAIDIDVRQGEDSAGSSS